MALPRNNDYEYEDALFKNNNDRMSRESTERASKKLNEWLQRSGEEEHICTFQDQFANIKEPHYLSFGIKKCNYVQCKYYKQNIHVNGELIISMLTLSTSTRNNSRIDRSRETSSYFMKL